MKRGMLAGASGLVGGFCLRELLKEPLVSNLDVYGRKAPVTHQKINFIECDFADFGNESSSSADFALCALGTTMKKAGSVVAFQKVDLEFVVSFARHAKSRGVQTFVVISSLGADETSSIVYNSTKGKMEAKLKALEFPSLVVLRPSLLLGSRAETRLMESLAIRLAPLYEKLLVGPMKKYRPITAEKVAQVACYQALHSAGGQEFIENDQLHIKMFSQFDQGLGRTEEIP